MIDWVELLVITGIVGVICFYLGIFYGTYLFLKDHGLLPDQKKQKDEKFWKNFWRI